MVVNCARVSFSKESQSFDEKDEKLIHYLAKHNHISPFYHPSLQFRIKAPISVQRQMFKHKIGTAENSESTRYVEVHDEFYVPAEFRAQSTSNKQGSSGRLEGTYFWSGHPLNYYSRERTEFCQIEQKHGDIHRAAHYWYVRSCQEAFQNYKRLVSLGVAKEQARDVLPLCTYTTWIWTASLAAVVHFIKLRDEAHAQFEIREYAKAMRLLTEEHFPVSLKALLEG